MKGLPIGKDNFRSLRNQDCYYVDKTGLIMDILDDDSVEVFLFTRPRRFGKTLNMTMIDSFFNIEYKGNHWFDGLKITEDGRYADKMNAYPVIFISMKGLDADDYVRFERLAKNEIKKLYDRFGFLRDSEKLTDLQKYNYRDVLDNDFLTVDPTESLRNLSEMLSAHYGQGCIILIDEYDNPIQNSYGKAVQSQIIAFMRGFMTKALKTSDSLYFGVVTGVMQIAKESIFSGLNNLKINNIFSKRFDEYFGFTESEVKEMLSYLGHSEKFDECRDWYDGYTFGDAEVYNPWSLLNYMYEDYIPHRYWAGTSGNFIIRTLLDDADEEVWNDLDDLAQGKRISMDLDESIVYSEIEHNTKAVYSIMAMSGYLKAKASEYSYELSIPNREMFGVYSDMLLDTIGDNRFGMIIKNLFTSMQKGDTDVMERTTHQLISETISAKVLDSEHAYQAYITGAMMGFCSNYRIHGDTFETGDGFADIIFERQRGNGPNIIMELKRSDSEDSLEKDAERAMQQILDKNYMLGMTGKVMLYGISFFRKRPYVISRAYIS